MKTLEEDFHESIKKVYGNRIIELTRKRGESDHLVNE